MLLDVSRKQSDSLESIAEVICVGWAYGIDRFFDDIARVHAFPIPIFCPPSNPQKTRNAPP